MARRFRLVARCHIPPASDASAPSTRGRAALGVPRAARPHVVKTDRRGGSSLIGGERSPTPPGTKSPTPPSNFTFPLHRSGAKLDTWRQAHGGGRSEAPVDRRGQ